MRAVLLRRMMVLGVCAVGVAALYLVPGVGAPTTRVGVPAPGSEITPRRSPSSQNPSGAGTDTGSVAARSASRSTFTPTTASYTTAPQRSEPVAPTDAPSPAPTEVRATSIRTTLARRPVDSRPGGTPRRVVIGKDVVPPESVDDLAVQRVDPDQVRLGWAPALDDVGVTGYRVWLNGYEVAYTSGTDVTLDWFNDDNATQVVAVRAVDAAGNRSVKAAMLLLRRPEPSAAPAPTPTAPNPAATDPRAEPADPTTDPTTGQTTDPTADPTTDPITDPPLDPATDPPVDPAGGPTAQPTPAPSPKPTPADRIR